MPNPEDKLTDIPRIVARRDDELAPREDAADSRKPARGIHAAVDSPSAASGSLRFMAVAGFLIAALAAAAAGWLYQQNRLLDTSLEQATLRISDLEGRLSSTDDSVNQSSAQMQLKI